MKRSIYAISKSETQRTARARNQPPQESGCEGRRPAGGQGQEILCQALHPAEA